MRIYVASSWRNTAQPEVVCALMDAGHIVYDFRHPAEDNTGFQWSGIDPDWQKWTNEQFRKALDHPIADKGFGLDMAALSDAEATVLVLPCGRSAHLELGWAAGRGQLTYVLQLTDEEPELMYKMCFKICTSLEELIADLKIQEEALAADELGRNLEEEGLEG